MRYIGQTEVWSCAPICILNGMKWAGQHITKKKDFRHVSKICGYIPRIDRGCSRKKIHKAIKLYLGKQYTIRKNRNVKIDELAEHVSHEDRAAMLIYVLCDHTTHIVFVESYDPDEKIFYIINFDGADETYAPIPRDVVVKVMSRKEKCPFAWFLRRR
jgi:hypothetical protein